MAGPLSPEAFAATRRFARKFGYCPNRDDIDCLIATVEDRDEQIQQLRQSLWDIYGILGFDRDGDPTPDAVRNDLAQMVEDAAREFRDDYDQALREMREPREL